MKKSDQYIQLPEECKKAIGTPAVAAALHEYDCAKAKRDSVSRKLCGGSTLVTNLDLANVEVSLVSAKKTLVQLAQQTPILEAHPLFAAVLSEKS
jgi:hypothetical protein